MDDTGPRLGDTRTRLAINALGIGAVLVGVVAVLLLARPRSDVDLGLHLAVGRSLVSNGLTLSPAQLPPMTVLEDVAYVPSQWLAQVIGYLAWSWLGQAGVLILRILALAALLVALAWACRAVAGLTGSLIAIVVATFGSAIAWAERPQLAGLAAFALTSALLWRSVDRHRLSLLVIPVVWLWAMLHGSWILGVALMACFAAGALLGSNHRRAAWLSAQTILTLGVAALNPLGWSTVAAPFTVSAAARASVAEWQRPAWTNPFLIAVLLGCAVTLLGWRKRRPDFTDVLVLLFAAVLALSMVRLVAFGAIALAPVLAASLQALNQDPGAVLPRRIEKRIWLGIGASTAAVTILISFAAPPALPTTRGMEAQLEALPQGTRIAVGQRLSGWVLWSHPDLEVMHDLRAEAYSSRVIDEYRSFLRAEPGWEGYASMHLIEAILVLPEEGLSDVLGDTKGWVQKYEDGASELWVRR